jgi:hypothetical protein
MQMCLRLTGRTATSIMTAGVLRELEHVLTPEKHEAPAKVPARWEHLWHPDPEVRAVREIFGAPYLLTAQEDETRVLIDEHRDAWFDGDEVIVANARALHAHTGELLELRRETRSRAKVQKRIVELLKEAGRRGEV